MTTSGSINFSVSRSDIIEEALKHLGALGEGETPTAAQLVDHSRTLNIMVKAWMAKDVPLWAVQRLTIFLEENKVSYTTGTDHIAPSSGVVRTTLSTAAASGASTVVVTSATGILTTYAIGIELDDGTVQWTTVNGAPSGTTITLTATITGAAASGNNVYVYTAKITATTIQTVLQAFLRDSDLQDVTLRIEPRKTYYELGVKNTEGSPNQITVQPDLGSTTILVYPEPTDETETIELVVTRTLEDFDAAGDTPDFPQEWYEALAFGLAARLSNGYGKQISERQWFTSIAENALNTAINYGIEHSTSIKFSPEGR